MLFLESNQFNISILKEIDSLFKMSDEKMLIKILLLLKAILILVINSMLKEVLLKMEMIKLSNIIHLVLFILVISIVKIQNSFTDFEEIE